MHAMLLWVLAVFVTKIGTLVDDEFFPLSQQTSVHIWNEQRNLALLSIGRGQLRSIVLVGELLLAGEKLGYYYRAYMLTSLLE